MNQCDKCSREIPIGMRLCQKCDRVAQGESKPPSWFKKLISHWPLMVKTRHLLEMQELDDYHVGKEMKMRAVIDKLYPIISDDVKVYIVPPDKFGKELPGYKIVIGFQAQNFNASSLEELTKLIGNAVIKELIKIKSEDDDKRGPRIIRSGR